MKKLPITLLLLTLFFSKFSIGQDSAGIFFKRGQEERTAKRFLVASQHFQKAVQLNPSFVDAIMANGFVQLEMRKTDAAREAFQKALDKQPGHKPAITELMKLHFNYRQYQKAIEFANKCMNCEGADRVIGISYYHLEEYPKAEKALRSALSQNAQDEESTYTLARTYVDMEEYKKAIPFFEKAIQLNNTKNVWMYELGLIYYNTSDFKSAVASFKKAAEKGYKTGNDFNETLGYSMIYSGEYQEGEQLLLKVLSNKPGNKDLLRDLAEVLYKQKQYDRSLVYCQMLIEQDPKDAKAVYQAGLNFLKKGNKEKGQQLCDNAIKIDPSMANLRQEKKMPGM